jgi:maleylpyruvate isomerase
VTQLNADDELSARIDGCRAAHAALDRTIAALPADAADRQSRLPGWTLAHVLTHVARNADSHVRMLEGARRGEVLTQYEGGMESRNADIEAGVKRPMPELVEDVRQSSAALEECWERMEPEAWDGEGLPLAGRMSCRELVFLRWREVEVHHADLGVGYEPSDWPEGYVARDLPRFLATLPARMHPEAGAAVLAWLLDREPFPSEMTLGTWQGQPAPPPR